MAGEKIETDDRELALFLEAIHSRYGYDFSNYSRASIKRRVLAVIHKRRYASIAEMQAHVLDDPPSFRELLSDLTVNVTEMFRDPHVYQVIRQQLIPVLRTYPSIRIWHAGCASGEEVYSMAILLREAGLYERSLLYATDISPRALERAEEAIYPANLLQGYTANYQKAGGTESFSKYYSAKYGFVKLDSSLKRNIVFSQHNLAMDEVFSEVHVVFCRNVLIYFNPELQHRVIGLFHRGLVRRGYLCLGSKETIEFSGMKDQFETVFKNEKIYRKL